MIYKMNLRILSRLTNDKGAEFCVGPFSVAFPKRPHEMIYRNIY